MLKDRQDRKQLADSIKERLRANGVLASDMKLFFELEKRLLQDELDNENEFGNIKQLQGKIGLLKYLHNVLFDAT